MNKIKNSRFSMLEYSSPQEALLQVFSFLLDEGKTKNYGVYYIWKKDDKFYTECPGAYHSVDPWREMGFETYDIVELKTYKRTYHGDKEEILTGFMFRGDKFFEKDIEFM